MIKQTNTKIKTFILHLLFWFAVWILFIYFFSYNSNNNSYPVWFSSFLLPITIITSYFWNYFLIPKYLLTKKYFLFCLYGFYTIIISTYLILLTIIFSFIFLTKLNFTNLPPMSKNYFFILILVYLVAGSISFVNILKNNIDTITKNKELENKILETQLIMKEQELLFLKSQIHPHFLFNTLNTIYGFALNQSEQTPELILKLSNLLDYILYQVNKPLVSLNKELEHLIEYIELEKIRFQDTLEVELQIEQTPENLQISPMLIIPLVENAFKHGSTINEKLSVNIKLEFENQKLLFSIKNSFVEKSSNKIHGIGIENLKKRLEMNYKNNYSLNFNKSDTWFCVDLIIFDLKKQ